MHLSTLLSLGSLALVVHAIPTPATPHVLHEQRAAAPVHWEKRDRVHASTLLPVRIGLAQSNLDIGPALLDEVATPGSPKYGQHYTAEQIHDLFAPKKGSVDTVVEWLDSAGISSDRVSQSVNKQWMQFEATAGEVESLIQTEYYHYEHLATGKTNIGCDKYQVPHHVQKHLDYITPGLKLLTPSMPRDGAIEKRTFGVTSPQKKKPILPPLKKALPQDLDSIVKLALEEICALVSISFLRAFFKKLHKIEPTTVLFLTALRNAKHFDGDRKRLVGQQHYLTMFLSLLQPNLFSQRHFRPLQLQVSYLHSPFHPENLILERKDWPQQSLWHLPLASW